MATVTELMQIIGSERLNPAGPLYVDAMGNVFGTEANGAIGGGSTLFELHPCRNQEICTIPLTLNSLGLFCA